MDGEVYYIWEYASVQYSGAPERYQTPEEALTAADEYAEIHLSEWGGKYQVSVFKITKEQIFLRPY